MKYCHSEGMPSSPERPCEPRLPQHDSKHRLAQTVPPLPFGHGQRFARSAGRIAHYVIGRWRRAGIFTLTSGRPFVTFDASFPKHPAITEKYNLEILHDITNLTNTPNSGFPTATFNAAALGRIRDSVASISRMIQMGARFYF